MSDHEAWQTFVNVYGPLVYRHARSRGLQDADAAEVTQEVLIRVSKAIQQFEYNPEQGRFRDWLGTIARNRICSFLRKEAGLGHGRDDADAEDALRAVPSPEQETEWTEEFNRHLLQTALERSQPYFDGQVWRAFEMVWLENRPAAEIAREMKQ